MQLLLPVTLNSGQNFETFVESKQSNGLVVSALKEAILSSDFTAHYIAGGESSGCSHLLSACCHYANQNSLTSILMPLDQVIQMTPAAIEGLENVDLVCIDNFDCIQGDKTWETAIFNLFNSLQQSNATLIFSGHHVPQELQLTLPDLTSRLQWCTLFQLTSLSGDEKVSALVQHAHYMGFELTEDVVKFMLNRLPRKMSFLMQALNTLAKKSIEKKRKVTVPFVKQELEI